MQGMNKSFNPRGRYRKNPWLFYLLTMLVGAVLLSLSLSNAAQGQSMRFHVQLLSDGIITEPSSDNGLIQVERSEQNSRIISDNAGRAQFLEAGTCLQIGAPDNITVIVRTGRYQSDTGVQFGESDSSRTSYVEARYINDGLGCPFDSRHADNRTASEVLDLAIKVSRPFGVNATAAFPLNRRGVAVTERVQSARRNSVSHLVLLERTAVSGDINRIEIPRDQRDEADIILIDIEYL
jgi:hypothetical protein